MYPLPDYIRPFAANLRTDKAVFTYSLQCSCGSESFYLYENKHSEEERALIAQYEASMPKTGLHTIHGGIGKNGKPYCYIRILGIFKKYITIPDPPYFMDIHVVKAVCPDCGKEILLFDSRLDEGGALSGEVRAYTPHFSAKKPQPTKVTVKADYIVENGEEFATDIRIYADKALRSSFELS